MNTSKQSLEDLIQLNNNYPALTGKYASSTNMKLNRRNALAAIGGLALTGGGVLGSGAFTTVSAQRTVNVNVITNTELGASSDYADVLIDVAGYDEVAVKDSNGNLNTDGTGLFPTSSDNYTSPSYGAGYVSLLQNDVELVFGYDNSGSGGSDNRILANSSVDFADLITLVNTAGVSTTGEHTMSFDASGFSDAESDIVFTNGGPNAVTVPATTADPYTVTVTAGGGNDTGATLDITINDPNTA